ncbi:UNVERIFIED_CONTAM: hypothetical protein Sangu_0834600 [Sesamum angustifolium]|uniref:Transposase n=1 Tax=Sesamum angustifolium TaxID=2727405 RepID=A0AAW2PWJ6_9LAMI
MNTLCVDDLKKINQCLAKIYQPHILEPWCDEALWASKRRGIMSLYPSSVDEITIDFIQSVVARKKKEWCREDNAFFSHSWANDKAVQKALSVREGTQWVRCNQTLRHNKPGPSGKIPYKKDVPSTLGYHKKFTQTNARVLVFREVVIQIQNSDPKKASLCSTDGFVKSNFKMMFSGKYCQDGELYTE